LGSESVQGWELFFGAEKAAEGDFEILAVEIPFEIKKMHFEDALARGVPNRWADANVYDAVMLVFSVPNFDGIYPVWRELLVMRAEIRGGKSEGSSNARAFDDGSENGKLAAKVCRGRGEIAGFDGAANEGAADDLPADFDGWDAHFIESQLCAQASEEG
jgi:hypothetical protein